MSYELVEKEEETQESKSFKLSLKKFFSPRKQSSFYSGYIKQYGEDPDNESPEMNDFKEGLEKTLF